MAIDRTQGFGDSGQWTEDEARRILASCARSGLSIRAFAMRVGLRPKRLYWWMRRLGFATMVDAQPLPLAPARRAARTTAPTFVPVVVKGASSSAGGRPTVVIRHGEGATMEIETPTAVSPAWIAAVMIELERGACS